MTWGVNSVKLVEDAIHSPSQVLEKPVGQTLAEMIIDHLDGTAPTWQNITC